MESARERRRGVSVGSRPKNLVGGPVGAQAGQTLFPDHLLGSAIGHYTAR